MFISNLYLLINKFARVFMQKNITDIFQVNRTIPCCKLAFKRCGTLKPFRLSITGSVISISFVSDSVHSDRGFYLVWTGNYEFVR